MPDTGFDQLFIVASMAVLAQLAVATMPSLKVPAVVELVVGVASVLVFPTITLGLLRDPVSRSARAARPRSRRVRV